MDGDLTSRTFTSRDFREALGLFGTGVVIATTRSASGERLGATISSFNSVSLDPPLILFSIARSAKAFAAWETTKAFAVNILSEEQTELSTRFAKPMADKWRDVTPHESRAGVPLLPGALVWIECSAYAKYDGGDHLILVGEVETLRVTRRTGRPLLFFGGKYRRLEAEPIDTPSDAGFWLHGW
jgi:flavin reductase (DIM6/NTAB) family NADH-FMN oxidoreductase RutF